MIQQNKPGLLGAVTTLMGMLEINILTVNGIGDRHRGFLLEFPCADKVQALKGALDSVATIRVTAFREPTLFDRLALRHGQRLDMIASNPPTYRFIREELGVLVDFLGDTLMGGGHRLIGIRGAPRVGKTEAAISACVYANKKWILLSSTIIRQTLRTTLMLDEAEDSIFLIDGITSTSRGDDVHWELLKRVMEMPTPKIIEHPEVFLRDGRIDLDFDFIIEIRNQPEDEIRTEDVAISFSSFDIS
ncbi:Protein of unknown function (DUF3388) [Desulfitobacterium dichloroeliminans LMG P-21439]|uniref:DUF3388 domain-containing protein n=1 Tax=Desulfitobacterium dichloroeliminans (strain LMG P-21439 / DCA1) TaxID=871963 RepID=L0F730_DESDL|nr:Protein of unknown function (DUF3388) [Desulfitobacterium dichloroeliminans LMG P-21439]